MPYSASHKATTRRRIVESARELFNRYGYADVTIDAVMAHAGLTRGGFYNHFSNKEALFLEVIEVFADCNPTERWDGVSLDLDQPPGRLVPQLIDAYLSEEHLADVGGQCPLVALPTDVGHAGGGVKKAWADLLEIMVERIDAGLDGEPGSERRARATAITALCVGTMLLARTVPDESRGRDILASGRSTARRLLEPRAHSIEAA